MNSDVCIADSDVKVLVKMTLTNGEVLNLGKNPRSPPTGLQLVEKVEIDSNITTICHYNGYTYVGQTSGAIDRIDEHGNVDKASLNLPAWSCHLLYTI